MNVATIGIDVAKNVFQIYGVYPHRHPVPSNSSAHSYSLSLPTFRPA
jgi:hypothetical protein